MTKILKIEGTDIVREIDKCAACHLSNTHESDWDYEAYCEITHTRFDDFDGDILPNCPLPDKVKLREGREYIRMSDFDD